MNYKEAYFKLFNEITDAVTIFDMALLSLKGVQQKTEQMIIADETNEEIEEGG
ncbi:MAG: hypothetical protein FWD48_07930 [Oscillospiraceae bacterium]|nr:hypothetical protein [Oscillospiraceae bacterium]